MASSNQQIFSLAIKWALAEGDEYRKLVHKVSSDFKMARQNAVGPKYTLSKYCWNKLQLNLPENTLEVRKVHLLNNEIKISAIECYIWKSWLWNTFLVNVTFAPKAYEEEVVEFIAYSHFSNLLFQIEHLLLCNEFPIISFVASKEEKKQ